jgi:ubiquinone/menaquinone biosynthesis C-methylase UbiE
MDAVQGGSASNSSENAIQSKDSWSKIAKSYSSMTKFPLHCGKAGLDAAKLQPGEKLLDVACGPGDLAVDAATRKGATVDCIDFSQGMIDLVNDKVEKEPVAVTGHVMDGQDLKFEDSSFDVVCSAFGVMLFPDCNFLYLTLSSSFLYL